MHVESVCTVVLSSALLFLYVCLSLPVGLEFRRLWRFGGIVFGNSGAFRAQSPGVRLALRILSWALWMSLLSMTLIRIFSFIPVFSKDARVWLEIQPIWLFSLAVWIQILTDRLILNMYHEPDGCTACSIAWLFSIAFLIATLAAAVISNIAHVQRHDVPVLGAMFIGLLFCALLSTGFEIVRQLVATSGKQQAAESAPLNADTKEEENIRNLRNRLLIVYGLNFICIVARIVLVLVLTIEGSNANFAERNCSIIMFAYYVLTEWVCFLAFYFLRSLYQTPSDSDQK